MGKMINFAHVNAQGTFTAVLNHHGLEFTQKGAQIRLHCPFHEDSNPSLSITLEATGQAKPNTFHCFGCGASGSLIDFEAKFSNVDLRTAAETVAEVSGCTLAPAKGSSGKARKPPESDGEARRTASKGKRRPAPEKTSESNSGHSPAVSGHNTVLNFTLKLDLGHETVLRRLDEEAAAFFGVGYLSDTSRSMMAGRICIPIHNAAGELVAYAGRWPDEDVPDGEDKYRFPPKFNKMAELFNLHRIEKQPHIVLVEGFFSAMRLYQLGVPTVALMGTAISDEQVTQLCAKGVRSVLVLLDGDDAGRTASMTVGQTLVRRLYTRVVELPDGQAPDTLDEQTLAGFLPFFRVQNQF